MTKEEIIKEFIERLRYLDESHGYNPEDVSRLRFCLEELLKSQREDMIKEIEDFRKGYQGVWRNENYQKDFNILIDKIKQILTK